MNIRLPYARMAICTGLIVLASCTKSTGGDEPVDPSTPPGIIIPQTDPALAPTIGFFADDWEPKTFIPPTNFTATTVPAAASHVVTIDHSKVITKVPRSLFGNNANTWMTQIVTEPVLMGHIQKIHPHIIRFPGGSISDLFFWNAQPDTPPADAPAHLINASGASAPAGYWFGKNSANWTLSVDSYYDMLVQTNNKGMITINYGYARYGTSADPVAAAAHLAADWVRYDNGRTRYWEIGNENFGDWEAGYRIDPSNNQDGQPEYLSGQLYGQHFKVFADSMRGAAAEIGKTIKIGAVMVEAESPSWATPTHRNWNAGMLGATVNSPDYYVVHSYFTNFNTNSSATEILHSPQLETGKIMEFVKRELQAAGVTIKPVVMNEWNIFAVGSRQQVSHVNGLHADLVLGELLKNEYGMSSRWNLANGWDNGNDHGMFNNGDEPDGVPRWNPRPAFYHMYFFQRFLGDRLIQSSIAGTTDIVTYASSYSSGEVGVTLVNKSGNPKVVEVQLQNFAKGNRFFWYTLTGGSDNGEFSRKVFVNGVTSTFASGGPANYADVTAHAAPISGGIRVTVPARAAIFMAIEDQ